MHLTPREQERLLLAGAAGLARRRLQRGSPLGATEAIALVCDEICEWAWDGVPLADIQDRATALLPPGQLLPGVAAMVPVVQVEALSPHGTVLVHVDEPFGPPGTHGPGAVQVAEETIILASERDRREVTLTNTGTRTVWISSHFPLEELNPAVTCDPVLPRRYRLDVPSGSAVSIPPGQSKELVAVAFARTPRGGHR